MAVAFPAAHFSGKYFQVWRSDLGFAFSADEYVDEESLFRFVEFCHFGRLWYFVCGSYDEPITMN